MKKSELKVSRATIAALRNFAKRQRALCRAIADRFITPYTEDVEIALKPGRTAYSLAESAFLTVHDEQRLTRVFQDQTEADRQTARRAARSFADYILALQTGENAQNERG